MDNTQSLNWTLINEMAAGLTTEQRNQEEWRIRNTGKLSMGDFKIAISFLFVLASLAFLGRIIIRVWFRRRIFLDDGLLIVGFVCLVASTAIFYKRARMIYLVFALLRGDQIASLIASQEISDVYDQMNWSFAYITFLWTTIFMVKFCYFAFFHTLLLSMSKALTRFYWASVIFTVIAWIYLVLQQLITCPYFGSSSFKCFPTLPISQTLLNFAFWTGPVLDVLTDAAIVSIPIIILRKSLMALLTKIGLGVFLCLSLFMLACSITRAAGTYYKNTMDTPWLVFWVHAEACIGVLMASITVYRSVLVGSSEVSGRVKRYLDTIVTIRSSERYSKPQDLTTKVRFGRFLLSKVPSATLTGLGTLFAEPSPTQNTDANVSAMNSNLEMVDMDYHVHLKSSRSAKSPQSIDETVSSHQGLWKAPGDWTTNKKEDEEDKERQRPPGRIAAFCLRFLMPSSYGVILQHRSIGLGQARTGVS